MMAYLKALWEKLVTKEKAIFKSTTMWYGGLITAMPDILQYMASNQSEVAKYLPHALQDPVFHYVGMGIMLFRMKSLVKLTPPAGS